MTLDINDLKILEFLDKNSRVPYDSIGKTVGLTGNAVRSRVIQMIDDQVIEKFVFKIHPEIFGVKTVYLKFRCLDKINTAKIIEERIESEKDPRFAEIITGINGEVVVLVYGQGQADLQSAIKDLKKKFHDFEFGFQIERYIPPLEEVKLNNSLLKIINCLIDNVRMSVADLAKICNMTSKSVKYYLKQIELQKIGRFSVNYQPYKISKRVFVNFFISKPKMDYIQFANLFEGLKKDLNSAIFKDYLLVTPPGIFCDITVESLEEIDLIEKRIIHFLKDDYHYEKMFPSRVIFRKQNLVHEIIRKKISELETVRD